MQMLRAARRVFRRLAAPSAALPVSSHLGRPRRNLSMPRRQCWRQPSCVFSRWSALRTRPLRYSFPLPAGGGSARQRAAKRRPARSWVPAVGAREPREDGTMPVAWLAQPTGSPSVRASCLGSLHKTRTEATAHRPPAHSWPRCSASWGGAPHHQREIQLASTWRPWHWPRGPPPPKSSIGMGCWERCRCRPSRCSCAEVSVQMGHCASVRRRTHKPGH
mmetsp:Transcript_1736/g.5714  ORF Transcript_1736/g.5714 Transcript_1736/m.5714 type:complete len:219 (+) Transcript_1736:418-1074(+)